MSDYSKIVNYAAKDSLVEGNPNKIIKGTELDAEFVAISNAIASKSDLNSPTFTGIPRAPTATFGTNTTQLATTAFVQQNGVPVGGIIMWSGLVANIPQGYALCNGENGTPDLRNKFIIGAGSTYSPAATGGADSVTLVSANIPSHTHTFTTDASGTHTHTFTTGTASEAHTHTVSGDVSAAGGHSHTVNDPGHNHATPVSTAAPSSASAGATPSETRTQAYTQYATTGITLSSVANHTHSLSTTSSSSGENHVHSGTTSSSATHTHTGTTGSTGSGTSFSILPSYFALAYIMRTA